jgi:hypothetical protein
MLSKKLSVIPERDNLAIFSQISPTSIKQVKEYSLKQNVFDPTKSSPPNEFMLKLKLRMSIYDSSNDDSLDIE